MKEIILLRHAKSSWEYDVEDRNRPLSQKGIDRITKTSKNSGGSFHLEKEMFLESEIDLEKSYKAKDLFNLLRAHTFTGKPSCRFFLKKR